MDDMFVVAPSPPRIFKKKWKGGAVQAQMFQN
jgi:hypothetical protein